MRRTFDASTPIQACFLVCKGKYPPIPEAFSPALGDVIKACLRMDATQRPKASQLKGAAPLVQRIGDFEALLTESVRRKRSTMATPARPRSRMSSIPWGLDGPPLDSPLKQRRPKQFHQVKTALRDLLLGIALQGSFRPGFYV